MPTNRRRSCATGKSAAPNADAGLDRRSHPIGTPAVGPSFRRSCPPHASSSGSCVPGKSITRSRGKGEPVRAFGGGGRWGGGGGGGGGWGGGGGGGVKGGEGGGERQARTEVGRAGRREVRELGAMLG